MEFRITACLLLALVGSSCTSLQPRNSHRLSLYGAARTVQGAEDLGEVLDTLELGEGADLDAFELEVEDPDQQGALGFEYAYEPQDWLVGFEVGFSGSMKGDSRREQDGDSFAEVSADVSLAEVYAGLVKSFGSGPFRPYVGGGVSFVNMKTELSLEAAIPAIDLEIDESDDVNDSSVGYYAHIGATYDLTDTFFVGVDARMLTGTEIDLEGFETDANYIQYGIVLGLSF